MRIAVASLNRMVVLQRGGQGGGTHTVAHGGSQAAEGPPEGPHHSVPCCCCMMLPVKPYRQAGRQTGKGAGLNAEFVVRRPPPTPPELAEGHQLLRRLWLRAVLLVADDGVHTPQLGEPAWRQAKGKPQGNGGPPGTPTFWEHWSPRLRPTAHTSIQSARCRATPAAPASGRHVPPPPPFPHLPCLGASS